MNVGIIYLIQPAELLGTSRYKVGCSKKNTLDRCRSYKKGSRYIAILEVVDPLLIEKDIKEHFTKKFKLIAGTEYFEGEERIMLSDFLKKVFRHKSAMMGKMRRLSENKQEVPKMEEVHSVFKNWKEDVSFGGKKQLFLADISDHKMHIKYICHQKLEEESVDLDYFPEYLGLLIENKVIEHGKIYNLHSRKFLKVVNSYKVGVNIEPWQYIEALIRSFKKAKLTPSSKVKCILLSNAMMNNAVHCNLIQNSLYFNFFSNIEQVQEKFSFLSINGKNYDSLRIRSFMPSRLAFRNCSHAYYLINEDNRYIGIHQTAKTLPIDDVEHLTDRSTSLWSCNRDKCEEILMEMGEKFSKLVSGKKCLNMNPNTHHLLKSFFLDF
jgi:hypothetical protein